MELDLGGRKELFRALFGSHNYNMNTKESDKDYKIFVAPTFDDLYSNNYFSNSVIGETEDYDIHDIRKVSHLWWKSNVNFVEVLFSENIQIGNVDSKTEKLLNSIFTMKNDIARMNLPYLCDACIGMHINKRKLVFKGTEGTQHLVDNFGYDTKQAMHSIRILNFLKRFADNDFTNFKEAIWYDDNELMKRFLLGIKNGDFSLEKYYEIADFNLEYIKKNYEEVYKSQATDVQTNDTLIDLVKEIVKIQI